MIVNLTIIHLIYNYFQFYFQMEFYQNNVGYSKTNSFRTKTILHTFNKLNKYMFTYITCKIEDLTYI